MPVGEDCYGIACQGRLQKFIDVELMIEFSLGSLLAYDIVEPEVLLRLPVSTVSLWLLLQQLAGVFVGDS